MRLNLVREPMKIAPKDGENRSSGAYAHYA